MTLIDDLTDTPEKLRLYQRERNTQEVTECVCRLLGHNIVTLRELAQRLGTTKGWVTRWLGGGTAITLDKLSDILTALGYELDCRVTRIKRGET